MVRWYPSPINVLELNFDASISANGTAMAFIIWDGIVMDFIIWDYTGQLIRPGVKKAQPYYVSFAELLAAWLGVKIAMCHLKIQKLWIEGNSLTVVKWLTSSYYLEPLHPLMHVLFHWK